MLFSFEAIVAVDQGFGLAKNGQIPWKSKTDMNFFKTTTTNNIVVMGAKTLLSLRNANPLPNRLNIVLTRDPSKFINDDKYKGFDNILFIDETIFQSFIKDPTFLIKAEHNKFLKNDPKIFIIGGEQIYKAYCDICSTIWLTKIKANYECDLIFSFGSILDKSDQYKSDIYYEDDELLIKRFQLSPGSESESDSLTK
jgi:dihydrofolate reductase